MRLHTGAVLLLVLGVSHAETRRRTNDYRLVFSASSAFSAVRYQAEIPASPGEIAQPRPARRRTITLDSSWHYVDAGTTDPTALDTLPQERWTAVTLPHTWNALDATDPVPGYRRDAGWYLRSLDLSEQPADARFVLRFEGANTAADVWVNGTRAGGHVGGYVGFAVDVTPYVRRTGANEILVRVTNAEDPDVIPSGKQDYVIYGGLTRDVWLDVLPPVSIAHLSVRTPG